LRDKLLEYETSLKLGKLRVDEAIAQSDQVAVESQKHRDMNNSTRDTMWSLSSSSYNVGNDPLSSTYGGSMISSMSKYSEHWDKKITKVHTVFRALLEVSVLNLISSYLRLNDLSGAWEYLNNLYLGRLTGHVGAFMTALEVYSIKRDQTFSRYVWIVEIIMDSCESIRKVPWHPVERLRIIEMGISEDSRFKHLCAAYQ
jgi:hypothetical protein